MPGNSRLEWERLLQDGRDRRFDLVLSEALDRLSRNQADIASIYQNLAFAGVGIVTLSEGRVDKMHVGLKGTMNGKRCSNPTFLLNP